MVCRLIVLDNSPGVLPIGIGEKLRRVIAIIFMGATGDQANTVCGGLQLCADLEAGIEGSTQSVA